MAYKFQFTLRTLPLFFAALAVLFVVGRWLYLNWDEYRVTTLHCGGGRKIIITAGTDWERSQPIMYQIIADGEIVASKYCFYFAGYNESLEISLSSTKNGTLVGVVNSGGDSHDVLILHDIETGESWPARFDGASKDAKHKRLFDAFDRLKAEHPGLRLSVRGVARFPH